MSKQLESSVARIWTADGQTIVGTGFLMAEKYVLTCAHVVAQALGLDIYTIEKPPDELLLDFPFLDTQNQITARVLVWKPREFAETNAGDDIAILELDAIPPASIQACRLIQTANLSGHRYKAYGFPTNYNSGVWSEGKVGDRLPNGRWQIADDKQPGIEIRGGFSGGPIWDEKAGGIIGMTVEEAEAKVAFMIPTEVLVKAWPMLAEWVVPWPFMVEDLPADFVPRPQEFEEIIKLLFEKQGQSVAITAALRGAGGYGKTTLAKAICYDKRIWQTFSDGILWVTLGETGNVLPGLTKVYRELTDREINFIDIEEAARELAKELNDKCCLLVIDDVWNEAHLRQFLRGGENCVRLITTRNSDTLPIDTRKVDVDAMRQNEAVALLGYCLPDENGEEFRQLAARLGEWPLLLKLCNGVLRNRVKEQKQTLSAALAYLKKALDKKGVTAFDARNAEERYQAVRKTLEVSLQQLTDDERCRYGELAIFPEDVDIPLAVLEKLWAATGELDDFDTEELCEKLKRLSLLLNFDLNQKYIRLHDVVRQYLISENRDNLATLHGEFLDARLGFKPQANSESPLKRTEDFSYQIWVDLPVEETYLWRYLAYHFHEAGRDEELKALLLNFDWLQAKLNATNVSYLIADYDFLLEDANLKLVQGAIRLSAHILEKDKTQLVGQLWGRLLSFDVSEIRKMLEVAKQRQTTPWLRLLTASLTPPGGALLRTLTGHTHRVYAVAIAPDGKLAVSASGDKTLKVWDLASGKELNTLGGHTNLVKAVAIAPNSKFAVSASVDKTLKVWDLASGNVLKTLSGHTDSVNGVAIAPDGKFAVSVSVDKTLKVWDLASGNVLKTLSGHTDSVNAVAIAPGGKFAVSASSNDTLKVWDLATGNQLKTLSGHTDLVYAVAIAPDGKFAVSASMDTTLKVWDLATGEERKTLTGHTDSVNAVAIAPNGKFAVSASMDTTLKVWDLTSGNVLNTLTGHTEWVHTVAIAPDGKFAVSASGDSTLKVWDLSSGNQLKTHIGHTNRVNAVAIAPDGKFAVSASWDHTVKIWDLSSGEERKTLSEHTLPVTAVAIAPDGKFAVSASWDHTLKVWDLSSGEERKTLTGHTNWVNAVAIAPNGKFAVSASGDSTLKVWDLSSGEERKTLTGHTDLVWGVAIAPNGKFAVSASDDNTLKVWDLSSGEERKTLTGHTNWVRAVAIAPDGKFAVSASDDNTLKIWDLASGKDIATFAGDSVLDCCAIAPDGVTIVAGEESGRVHFLRLEGLPQPKF
ncbi:NB-ARC domain-containing protein [Aerosakkonema sp. BLCC-F183]|uniref:NB-ARC domain-containing protein n=1 Tax=Aerosakkonema sp. BLCC-F183 TaxID=3342834 RepID=UPI0035B9D0C0